MSAAMKLMKQAGSIKSRRHLRIIRGKFQKAISALSEPLRDSAMREFRRRVQGSLSY